MNNSILETLVNILIKRFADAGLDMPKESTEKDRLGFVFGALDKVAILPSENFNRLVSAAEMVVNRWESGDLAGAVRDLALALPKSP
jgi:hypothetical protein